MRDVKKVAGLFVLLSLLNACIEPYDPQLDDVNVNYLVVDGFLNATTGIATVHLSRTLPVNSDDAIPRESGASVHIEDGSGHLFPLAETNVGIYTGLVPDASSVQHYRLQIRTANHRQYLSDFVNIINTPPIDSVTWSVVADGIEFSVTTHDPSAAAQFYRWKYAETYEYEANFNSLFRFEGNEVVFRPPSESLFTCWKTNESTRIMVGSTKKLQESVIHKYAINFVPAGSVKISTRYSLLVAQQAITEEAYDYWLSLDKSTENLGGLFDPLPSAVEGNIHSQTDPGETVIGFFGAGAVRETRLFVNRNELPGEITRNSSGLGGCELDTVLLPDLGLVFEQTTLLVDAIYSPFLVGYTTAPIVCADCQVQGGTTIKPPFWD